MEHFIELILPPIISILELMGIFIVVWTAGRGFWEFLSNIFRKTVHPIQYGLASGLSVALGFKMAAEILKTVIVASWEELFKLGAIVVLRAAIGLLLHFELKHSKHDFEAAQELEGHEICK